MAEILPVCRMPGCAEPVHYRARKEGLCKYHHAEQKDREERVAMVLVEKYLVRQFTEPEIAELVDKPVSWVKETVAKIRAENAIWVQAVGQDRLRMVMNDLLRNSRDRQNELWVSVANDPKQRVRALKALREEDQFVIQQLQGLGYLPKTADQINVHSTVESIVLNMDLADERGKTLVIDAIDDELDIPVEESTTIPMELLLDASVREEDLTGDRFAYGRANAALPSGSQKVLRESPLDRDEGRGKKATSAEPSTASDLQRDPEEAPRKEAGKATNLKGPSGWSLDPDGGVAVHEGDLESAYKLLGSSPGRSIESESVSDVNILL